MTEFFIKNILAEELFGVRICESIEDRQIVNFFYDKLLLEKLLFGEPISVPELRKLLRNKIINFEFIKLDGEVRPARGTTMMKYIPKSDHPKGIRPSSPKVATFFDLEKEAWRSVSKRSKEIVLKRDEEKGKPVIVVKDKEEKVAPEVEPRVEPRVEPEPRPRVEPEPRPRVEPEPRPRVEPEPRPRPILLPPLPPEEVEEPVETIILFPQEEPPEGEVEPKELPKTIIPEEPPEEEIGEEGPEEEEIE